MRQDRQQALSHICDTIVDWLRLSKPEDPTWSPEMWLGFRWVCQVQGVAPALYTKIGHMPWLNATTRTWLQKSYSLNTARISKLHTELKPLLQLFRQHNIPLLPLKGAILSTAYNHHSTIRPMADLDILVKPGHLAGASQLLTQLGYERKTIFWKEEIFIKPDNVTVVSREFEHPDNPRSVELHCTCREKFGGPTVDITDYLWANVKAGQILTEDIPVLSPDALWLHLLIHHSSHAWLGSGRLIQLLDIACLVPYVSDPLSVLNQIDARYTYISLMMLKKYFPDVLDLSIYEACQARVSTPFQTWASSFDLLTTSYLKPKKVRLLWRAIKFHQNSPQDLQGVFRYVFFPHIREMQLNHTRLNSSNWVWIEYPFHWAKHLINLTVRW